MKITRIILHHLRMNLRSPFETSFGSIQSRDCILLEAFCDDQVGYGECAADRDPGFSYETAKTAWHILQDFLVPVVLNQKISNADDLQQRMSFVRGHPMAKAGLEMAVWDLLGKRGGISLKQLLGGEFNRVEVGVSIGIQESPPELINTIESYLAQGYNRVKIKIKPGRDIDDTSAVRKAYPDLRLQVDANSAYSLESAQSLLPLDELDLLLIEQPLSEDDLWDHSLLQKEFNTPICLDESIISPRHARQALEMKACKVINIKSGRVGGQQTWLWHLYQDSFYQEIFPPQTGTMKKT
jgi:O-succinylbenzoate synthase